MTLPEVAAALASYLALRADLDHRQIDVLRFGLEIIMGALVAQDANLTPIGYRFIARYDRRLSEIRSRRRCASDVGRV